MNKFTLGVSRRRVLHTFGAFAAAAPFLVSRAYAAWPDRPVKIIVPFGPGGPVDVIARLLQPFLTEELKGNFFIENKPARPGPLASAKPHAPNPMATRY